MFNFKLVTLEINSRLCSWHNLISQEWSLTPTADKVKKVTIIWEIWNKRNLFTKKYDCLRKRKLCMTIIILYFNDLFFQRRSSLMYVYFCFFYSLLWSGGNARCLLDRQPYALVVWFLNSEELLFKRSRNLFILKSIENFFSKKGKFRQSWSSKNKINFWPFKD